MKVGVAIPSVRISRLTPAHTAEYRAVMLQAYADERDAFTSTVSEREPLPLEWWQVRVSDKSNATELVLGAFVGARLVGVAGLRFERRERVRHKAWLFGMYVLPPFRGQGIARALAEAALGLLFEVDRGFRPARCRDRASVAIRKQLGAETAQHMTTRWRTSLRPVRNDRRH